MEEVAESPAGPVTIAKNFAVRTVQPEPINIVAVCGFTSSTNVEKNLNSDAWNAIIAVIGWPTWEHIWDTVWFDAELEKKVYWQTFSCVN